MAMLRIPELNVISFLEVPQPDALYPYFTMRACVSQERFTIIHSSGFAQSQSPRHFEQPSGAKDLLFADVKESGSPSRLESTQNGNFIYPGEISDTRGQLLSANWGRIPK